MKRVSDSKSSSPQKKNNLNADNSAEKIKKIHQEIKDFEIKSTLDQKELDSQKISLIQQLAEIIADTPNAGSLAVIGIELWKEIIPLFLEISLNSDIELNVIGSIIVAVVRALGFESISLIAQEVENLIQKYSQPDELLQHFLERGWGGCAYALLDLDCITSEMLQKQVEKTQYNLKKQHVLNALIEAGVSMSNGVNITDKLTNLFSNVELVTGTIFAECDKNVLIIDLIELKSFEVLNTLIQEGFITAVDLLKISVTNNEVLKQLKQYFQEQSDPEQKQEQEQFPPASHVENSITDLFRHSPNQQTESPGNQEAASPSDFLL